MAEPERRETPRGGGPDTTKETKKDQEKRHDYFVLELLVHIWVGRRVTHNSFPPTKKEEKMRLLQSYP